MTENAFTDPRDDQTYRIIELNGQLWMTENLNYSTEGSWWYQDNETHGKEYGRLYTWDAAQKACPPGWRLPSDNDWQELMESFGGIDSCYEAFMEGGISGLNILLGGYRDVNGKFGRNGAYGGYWTGNEKNAEQALGLNFDGYYEKVDFSDSLNASAKYCRGIMIK